MRLYHNIKEGIFIKRPNRFLAEILINGKSEICHVKNTGRCKELLIPEESIVFVEEHENLENRKTKYSLVAVKKGEILVNIDSQAPNKAVYEWINKGGLIADVKAVKAEKKYGNSRFDFYVETKDKKLFAEVKGVTLEQDGIARFPDAPTERGLKHIEELCTCIKEGYEAAIIFVIQMKGVTEFRPNYNTHPDFGKALQKAEQEGVKILAYDCIVTKNEMGIDRLIPIHLEE